MFVNHPLGGAVFFLVLVWVNIVFVLGVVMVCFGYGWQICRHPWSEDVRSF